MSFRVIRKKGETEGKESRVPSFGRVYETKGNMMRKKGVIRRQDARDS